MESVPQTRSDQAYYWSDEWQRGEREAMGELERGEAETFDSAGDASAWLRG